MKKTVKNKINIPIVLVFSLFAMLLSGCGEQSPASDDACTNEVASAAASTSKTCAGAASNGVTGGKRQAAQTNAVPFVAGLEDSSLSGFRLQFSGMPDLNRLMDFI